MSWWRRPSGVWCKSLVYRCAAKTLNESSAKGSQWSLRTDRNRFFSKTRKDCAEHGGDSRPPGLSEHKWTKLRRLHVLERWIQEDPYNSLFGASNEMLAGRGFRSVWKPNSLPQWMRDELGLDENTQTINNSNQTIPTGTKTAETHQKSSTTTPPSSPSPLSAPLPSSSAPPSSSPSPPPSSSAPPSNDGPKWVYDPITGKMVMGRSGDDPKPSENESTAEKAAPDTDDKSDNPAETDSGPTRILKGEIEPPYVDPIHKLLDESGKNIPPYWAKAPTIGVDDLDNPTLEYEAKMRAKLNAENERKKELKPQPPRYVLLDREDCWGPKEEVFEEEKGVKDDEKPKTEQLAACKKLNFEQEPKRANRGTMKTRIDLLTTEQELIAAKRRQYLRGRTSKQTGTSGGGGGSEGVNLDGKIDARVHELLKAYDNKMGPSLYNFKMGDDNLEAELHNQGSISYSPSSAVTSAPSTVSSHSTAPGDAAPAANDTVHAESAALDLKEKKSTVADNTTAATSKTPENVSSNVESPSSATLASIPVSSQSAAEESSTTTSGRSTEPSKRAKWKLLGHQKRLASMNEELSKLLNDIESTPCATSEPILTPEATSHANNPNALGVTEPESPLIPHTYRVLAYDSLTDTLTTATTTTPPITTKSASSTPLALPDALSKLANPGKFLPHLPLSFEPITATANLLILRETNLIGPRSASEAKTDAQIERSGEPESARSESSWGINPIDGTTIPLPEAPIGNFASPTGFVNHDPISGSEGTALPAPVRNEAEKAERNWGRRGEGCKEMGRRRKGGVAAVMRSAIWATAVCYVAGVAGEVVK